MATETQTAKISTGKLLQDKVIVITGAGRGIGKCTAELFAAHGAKLVLADIDAGPANETLEAIKALGSQGVVVAGNIVKREDCDKICKAAAELGDGSIDCIANIAGITKDAVIHKMTEEQWDFVVDINMKGTFNMIQASVPYMRDAAKREQDAGQAARPRSIINVSSTSGVKGNAGQLNYAAAKEGLRSEEHTSELQSR